VTTVFLTSSDGFRLHARADAAGGVPLVFSNSLGTDLTLWDAQARGLDNRSSVWRYDTRGHGQSNAPPGEYSLDALGRDLLSVVDAASSEPVDLCGISIGGQTVLWAAIHAPQRVRRLVVANSAARIGDVALWNERIRIARSEGLKPLADASMERWFTARFRQREPETVERFRATLARTSVDGYVGCCAALRDADLRPLVRGITCPTLIITGAHDPATPPDSARWLAAEIRGARYVELDCAHLSNVECAAGFNQALRDFLHS
jgi:3-oxoadipate enol-lactonase